MKLLIFCFMFFIPYGNTPDWESGSGFYSTGGGFCDIDEDGDMDFVVSNGNDMQREKNVIYFNINGAIEVNPSWFSNDNEYSGHLSINDFDNDGYIDFAVSNYLGPAGFSEPGNIVIYKNINGTPDPNFFWKSQDSTYTFSCDFGDVDGDGYAEIAIAGGERYHGIREKVKIYKNTAGGFSNFPFWKSANEYFSYDVLFYDINLDGYLDLVVACNGEKNLIFYNNFGELETIPSWMSHDQDGSIQVDVGDVDGNGFPDLIFANNGQLPPYSSNIKIYLNQNGFPDTLPAYTLDISKNYYSSVSLCDIDYDGDLDIGGGGWWEPLVIFENFNGYFHNTPDWEWSAGNGLVCEKVTFTEIDKPWVFQIDTFIRGQNEPVYTFKRRNLCGISSVVKIDSGLNFNIPEIYYTFSLESGWISINKDLTSDFDTFLIEYFSPSSYDITVTNWQESRGNFYFLSNIPEIAERKDYKKEKRISLILKNQEFKGEVFDPAGKINKNLKGVGFLRIKGKTLKIIILP